MQKYKTMKKIIVLKHECPYRDDILVHKFSCDNLKFDGDFSCKVCRCPYDNTQYEETEIEIPS